MQKLYIFTEKSIVIMKRLVCFAFFLAIALTSGGQSYDVDYITNQDGLSNSSVIKVFQDSEGIMWFGTWDGLNAWNSRDMRSWKSSKDDPNSISSNVVRDITEDSGGNIWVCTDRGVDLFDRKSATFTRFFTEDAGSIDGEQPFALYSGPEGLFVFLDKKGIWQYVDGQFTKIFDSPLSARRFRMEGVVPIILDKDGHLYKSNLPLDHDPVLSPYIGNNDCYQRGDSLYVANNSGLYLNGLPILENVPVLSVLRGSQDIIWAGTDMHGVARVNPEGPRFASMRDMFGGSAVRCFMEDASGRLMVGTKGSGIYLLAKDGRTDRHITVDNGLLSNSVYCIADTPSRIWIGTDGNGLNYIRKPGGHIYQLDIPDSLKAFSPVSVYSILPKGRDTLWIGTSGKGLIMAVVSDRGLVAAKRYDASLLGSNVVYSILDGPDGTLWIGTRGGGLRRLHLDSDTVEYVPSEYDVLSLAATADGTLWAGTGDGLDMIAPDGALRRFTQKEGLPNNTVHGIVPEDNGSLWVSTNRGLALIEPGRNEVFSYFASDGLQDNEFSDGAYYRDPQGHIYFGGLRGFTRFDATADSVGAYSPPLLQDGFFIDNEPVAIDTYMRKGRLTLRHSKGSFSFRFVPLDYLNSQRCELQYMLEGFNRDWVRLGTSSTVVFSNLDVGDYTLRVKCSSSERRWGSEAYVLPIRIVPRWWESPLAYLFYLALISGLILYIRKVRRDRAEARKIKEIHQAKLQFFSDMGYNLSNALTLMHSPGEQLKGGRLTSDQQQYLETIESGSNRMQGLVQQFIAALDDIPVPEVPKSTAVHRQNEELEPGQVRNDDLLIVDHDASIRAFVGALLSSKFNILEAGDGEAAIEMATNRPPSLIICAMKLGDMDGLDFLTKARAESSIRHIPIIMLSGKDTMDRQIAALERGADAYLPKPFNPKHLMALAQSLLGRGEVNREYGGSARSAVQQIAEKTVKNEDRTLVLNIAGIILNNIENENLSVEMIASQAALSKMQLYRRLKAAVDMTPTEFIRHIRLENARKLLTTSHKTAQQIMYACGFANKTYFYREFKKKYGLTPKQYRDIEQQ